MSSIRIAAYRVASILTIVLASANAKLIGSLGASEHCCQINDGCFPLRGEFFHFLKRPMNFAPDCAANVRFFLNTRANLLSNDEVFDMSSTPQDVKAASTFDASRARTLFIVHGFTNNGENETWMLNLRDALLAHADWNILRVDWRVAAFLPYTQVSLRLLENKRTVN